MNELFRIDDNLFLEVQKYVGNSKFLDWIFIFLAEYLVYAIPVLLVGLWFWQKSDKSAVFKAALAALVGWCVFSKIIAVMVERPRPSQSLIEARELIFHRPDTSFPSDHSTMLFGLALALYLFGYKRLGKILFVAAALIGFARVWVGVHFPFDILAGMILGCLSALLVWWQRKNIDKYISEPFIKFLGRMKL